MNIDPFNIFIDSAEAHCLIRKQFPLIDSRAPRSKCRAGTELVGRTLQRLVGYSFKKDQLGYDPANKLSLEPEETMSSAMA